jgi:hypothetical protein
MQREALSGSGGCYLESRGDTGHSQAVFEVLFVPVVVRIVVKVRATSATLITMINEVAANWRNCG